MNSQQEGPLDHIRYIDSVRCGLRVQYAYSHNSSNIDIYDFNRHEISSMVRCDTF